LFSNQNLVLFFAEVTNKNILFFFPEIRCGEYFRNL
jgi:hypothetical protein